MPTTDTRGADVASTWPSLPLEAWRETYATLHRWTQIVGKTRLALAPMMNHWWHVAFTVTARGLSTTAIPYGTRAFEVELDFIDHRLDARTSAGTARSMALAPRTVAEFYEEYLAMLDALGIQVTIWPVPVEVDAPIPFAEDRVHAAYDAEFAHRFWCILLQAHRVMEQFRGRFLGKSSPVQFFWGSFDLAVTRFSGRVAPPHPGGTPNVALRVMREAYSHELFSAGFWPGGGSVREPAFYAYAYPEPPGLSEAPIQPDEAFYHPELHEFILPYDAVRAARAPDAALTAFLQSTYGAAATLARWDRAALERPAGA